MDRLRSLQYFVSAAESGSYSGAARALDLSVGAVSKLVTALEREMGVLLFERHPHGLALTSTGASYLEACRPALAMLAEAEAQATASNRRARGTVVVAVQPVIAQECLATALPRFNALYPEIQLDIRFVRSVSEEQSRGVDVFLFVGWPQQAGHLVQRQIGAANLTICASPSYWASHGMPQHPIDLERHNCLAFRGNNGVLMDQWDFQRGDERVSVTARGWLLADTAHRDVVRDVALSGGGVARLVDWHNHRGGALGSGDLVAALTDWQIPEVPPVSLLFPPSVRRVPRVRLFMDFVTETFRDIEQRREKRTPASAPPRWMKGPHVRASSSVGRR